MQGLPQVTSPLTLWLGLMVSMTLGCGESSTGAGQPQAPEPDTLEDTEAPAPDIEEDTAPPPPPCLAGTPWTAGTPVFVEVTEDWGLQGVQGQYLSVTDLDGDGWPDLLVRNGGGPDDFAEGGERSKWLLRNTGAGGFEDVTQASGVFRSRLQPDPQYGRPVKVVASGDVDNDGDLDVFVSHSRTDLSQTDVEGSDLMLNQGDGTFVLGPEGSHARFATEVSNPAGATFVDFDRDGLLDLWVVHNEMPGLVPMADSLLRGQGDGSFVNVTSSLGLSTLPWQILADLNAGKANSWGWSAAACDLNQDGLPELLASSYGRAPNHLWRAIGEGGDDVAYVNASVDSGYAFDENQDWRDNLNAQCYCMDHPDAIDCDSCPAPADLGLCASLKAAFGENYRWNHDFGREAFSLGGVTGTTLCTDINNDGRLDLVNYEIVHSDVGKSADATQVLVNTGEPTIRFERPGVEATGLVRSHDTPIWDDGDMTGAVFDFDNDGWQDIYIGSAEYAGTRGHLFRQAEAMKFEAVDPADFFLQYRAHGVAVADFDRDGDLDVLVGHSRFRCEGFEGTECGPDNQVRLFENQQGAQNNWVQIRLIGAAGSNGSATGARVELAVEGMIQAQEVDGGHGRFGMQRDATLHFGLGSACEAQALITWPDMSHSTQSIRVYANQRVRVVQGAEPVVEP